MHADLTFDLSKWHISFLRIPSPLVANHIALTLITRKHKIIINVQKVSWRIITYLHVGMYFTPCEGLYLMHGRDFTSCQKRKLNL